MARPKRPAAVNELGGPRVPIGPVPPPGTPWGPGLPEAGDPEIIHRPAVARGLPMGAHRVPGHTGAHGRPMGSPFHKWVRAGQHFSQFQPGPARPLRSRAASGWPMGGPSPPDSHP
ncbi:hypothetical protein PCANC_04144 [Puccinia coronata f. sp. avenae]|uniref:Uncharacterized protein n=1 Tax=Puccinia coronata f. sp. avenae TaxID=200324 RepID=A0A2N5W785_9BASI|nr:hypothetical protein PCANC_04144 [Puccinia coronata f. sp. avenae]